LRKINPIGVAVVYAGRMRTPSSPGRGEPGPVILVDDDGAVLDALAFALRLEGISVQPYGDAALLLLDDNVPAAGCMVLDYQMPLMNGIDRLEQLRERAWRAGFVAVLEKPLEDSSLLESIRMALLGARGASTT
jgi:two-component system response regulator FixJ